MEPGQHHPPGLGQLLGRLLGSTIGALKNRVELFSIELQEERIRLALLLVFAVGLLFMAVSGTVLLAALIVLLVPPEARVYTLGGLVLLFWAGAVVLFFALKNVLGKPVFPETLEQARKDAEWLESMK